MDENAGILPFIKKKVEGFSLHSTNRSRAAIYFSPIWNGWPPSFQHRAAAVFLCGKGGENCSFPHRKSAGGVQMMCRCAAMVGDRRFRMPAALLWASSAEKRFFSLGQRSACGRSAVPFSRERAWTAGSRSRACFLWKRRCGGKVFAAD